MENLMSEFKATANAHMGRDVDAQGQWVCTCEACHAIRSLVGIEKTLHVRDLVRQVLEVEEQLKTPTNDAKGRRLMERYWQLYDQLGDEVSR
jgi:cytochrome c553